MHTYMHGGQLALHAGFKVYTAEFASKMLSLNSFLQADHVLQKGNAYLHLNYHSD